jgi:RNA polymerase sigma-70 factor, ECF subfamily
MDMLRATGLDKDLDSALVTAAKRGTAQAFEEIVSRHKQKVLAVAQRITNNREDAEDVTQESFLKAFLHLEDFEGKSRFSSWLTRIVMNEALMLRRRRRRVFEVLPGSSDDDVRFSPEVFVDQSSNPEESCWQRERMDLLTKAINRLGPRIRSTILLRDIEERSVEETAKILGTSAGAVKARVFQGRRKLRSTVNAGLLWGVYPADPGRGAALSLRQELERS